MQNGRYKTSYSKIKDDIGQCLGREYAKISLGQLKRATKNYICDDFYIDIDMNFAG